MEDYVALVPPYSATNRSGKTEKMTVYMCPHCDYTITNKQLKYREKYEGEE